MRPPSSSAASNSRRGLGQHRRIASRTWALVDDERRQQPHHIVAGRQHDQALASRAAAMKSPLGTFIFRPSIRPWPRTFLEHGGMSGHQRAQLLAQVIADLAAHAPGSPAPVPGRARHCPPPWPADCRHRWCHGCPRSCPWPLRAVASMAPSGKPPPMPLATHMMSGVDARPIHGRRICRCGPMPVWISSKISSRPFSSQSLRRARRNSGVDRAARRPRPGSARS